MISLVDTNSLLDAMKAGVEEKKKAYHNITLMVVSPTDPNQRLTTSFNDEKGIKDYDAWLSKIRQVVKVKFTALTLPRLLGSYSNQLTFKENGLDVYMHDGLQWHSLTSTPAMDFLGEPQSVLVTGPEAEIKIEGQGVVKLSMNFQNSAVSKMEAEQLWEAMKMAKATS
eukprot:GHVU01021797.1.p1 GENE.GHVU01021797.1~~GHVU01021797.1.p1  ORF type:complete len:195 (-),score=18.53 GHVU01021797.1:241-747(-)